MRFGERIVLFVLRPVYRAFFQGPLARFRASLLSDISARSQSVENLSVQLRDAEANLAAQLHNLRAELIPYLQRAEASLVAAGPSVAAQLHRIEANNAAQWDALEQLLLAMFHLPQSQMPASAVESGTPEEAPYLKAIELNQAHAVGNLR